MKTPSSTPFFSICTPMYNAKDSIEGTIHSVLNQSFCDFEMVIVDDGSSDSSGEAVRKFAESDERIRYVKQSNAGVFHARLHAFRIAHGQFIVSLDADDFLEENALKVMYDTINSLNADFLIYNYNVISESGTKYTNKPMLSHVKAAVISKTDVIERYMNSTVLNSIWQKAFKRDLLELDEFASLPRISMGDDRIHSFYPLLHAKTIAYIPDGLVNYRLLSSSLTMKYDYSLWKTQLYISKIEHQFLSIREKGSINESFLDRKLLTKISIAILYVPGVANNKLEFFQMLDDIKNSKQIFEVYGRASRLLKVHHKLVYKLLYNGNNNLLWFLKKGVEKVRRR